MLECCEPHPLEPMHNFNPEAQLVLALARKEAIRLNHTFVGTEHVLLGMIKLLNTLRGRVYPGRAIRACQPVIGFVVAHNFSGLFVPVQTAAQLHGQVRHNAAGG